MTCCPTLGPYLKKYHSGTWIRRQGEPGRGGCPLRETEATQSHPCFRKRMGNGSLQKQRILTGVPDVQFQSTLLLSVAMCARRGYYYVTKEETGSEKASHLPNPSSKGKSGT